MTRIAASRYRQLKLTYTEEVGGRVSYRIYAKALNSNWTEQHLIAQGRVDTARGFAESPEDALRTLYQIIGHLVITG